MEFEEYLIDVFYDYIIIKYGTNYSAKFSKIFGVTVDTTAVLYGCAVEEDLNIEPNWIFQFLHWIQQYPTNKHESFIWQQKCKTVRNHVFSVLWALFDSLDMIYFIYNYLFIILFNFNYYLVDCAI